MKRRIGYGVLGLLLILNVSLLIKNSELRRKIKQNAIRPTIVTSSYLSVPVFTLKDLDEMECRVQDLLFEYSYTLFVFFSPSDCASCLYESNLWRRLSDEKRINVIGIAKHSDKRELVDWATNNGLTFRVLFDQNMDVTRAFGVTDTPFRILADRYGKIILTDKVRVSNLEQEAFYEYLNTATR